MNKTLLIVMILFLGVGLLLYPRLAAHITDIYGTQAVQDYSTSVGLLDRQQLTSEWERAVDYNNQLSGDPVHDPFVPGSGMVLNENYLSILNIDGKMGSVEIPKIKVNLPIYHGTSDETLKKGIGHLEGTTLPVGGPNTHAVLTGHRGLTNARLFTDLVELSEGDFFYIHILDEVLAYRVDQIMTVNPEDVALLRVYPAQDYVTLITCTPYGVNSHRLMVRGVRTAYEPGHEKAAGMTDRPASWTEEQRSLFAAAAITCAIMLPLILLAIPLRRKRDRRMECMQLNMQMRFAHIKAPLPAARTASGEYSFCLRKH